MQDIGVKDDNGKLWRAQFVVSVYGIYRQGGHANLLLGVRGSDVNGSLPPDAQGRLQQLLGRVHDPESDDPSSLAATGLTLIDPVAQKAYLVARDKQANGDCLCPASVRWRLGVTTAFSATFAAPPAGTSAMTVRVPNWGYFPDVPVTDGAPPRLPTPGPQNSTVYSESPDSTVSPVKAPVVDLDTPVANLDLSVTEKKNKVVLAADVLFAFDKATLTGKAKSRIAQAAKVLRTKGVTGKVRVNGYTDSLGSKSYNLDLSKRRAKAVRQALAPRLKGTGITLVPEGHGEADPVAPNRLDGRDNPKGRTLNRRVEVVYPKPGGSAGSASQSPPSSSQEPSDAASSPTSTSGSSPVPTPTQTVARKQITFAKHKFSLEVYGLSRDNGLVTLYFGLKNTSGTLLKAGDRIWGSPLSRSGENDVSGVYLVDGKHKKKYLPAKAGKECMCTNRLSEWTVGPDQTIYLTASYAAPPEGVDSMNVTVPHLATLTDIPVR